MELAKAKIDYWTLIVMRTRDDGSEVFSLLQKATDLQMFVDTLYKESLDWTRNEIDMALDFFTINAELL